MWAGLAFWAPFTAWCYWKWLHVAVMAFILARPWHWPNAYKQHKHAFTTTGSYPRLKERRQQTVTLNSFGERRTTMTRHLAWMW